MDSKSSLGFKYDLDTEIGIKSILVAIRKSQLPVVERNELRDLVFLFINGGRDETVRNALMQKLAVSGLEVKDLSKKQGSIPDNAPVLSFGVYREVPTFSAPVVADTSATTEVPAVVAATPTPIIPPVVAPMPVAVPPPVQPQPAQATVIAGPAPVATPAPIITQESIVATPVLPVQTPIVSPSVPIPTPDLVAPLTSTPPSSPMVATQTTPASAMAVPAPVAPQMPVASATAPTPTGVVVNSQPVPVISTPAPEGNVTPESPVAEVFSKTPPVAVPSVAPIAAPRPVVQSNEPASVIVTETVVAVPNSEPVVPPVISKAEASLPTVEKEVTAPTPTPAPVSALAAVSAQVAPNHTTTNYLNRIRDIKASVNNKVGNPVNLIDINNEVGREYMNALLDAMKKVNGGLVGELDEAMARLETAFLAVEKAVADNDTQAPTPVAIENNSEITTILANKSGQKDNNQTFVGADITEKPSEAVEKLETQKKVESPVDLAAALSELPENEVIETEEREKTISAPPETNLSAAKLVTPAESGFADPEYKDGSFNQPVPRPAKESIRETVNALKLDQEAEETKTFDNPFASVLGDETKEDGQASEQSFTPKLDTANPAENSFNTKLASIAEEKTPLTPLDLPETKDTDKATDPLFSREVDDGLDQLLADWTLFKKSGLFGTGPKGREHPLFKKMAELQIPLILSGRFDGATQEIKQSVTDYMNGWRYEQGVVYEQGETFELYLRRVIRHILDLQK